MTIKAIVLDIGGVIVRTEDLSYRRNLEIAHNLPPYGADALVFHSPAAKSSSVGKGSVDTVWEHVASTLSLSPSGLRAFKQQFWQGDRADQELLRFIMACRPQYTTALLSNAWVGARQQLARDFGIIEGVTVDHILISAELGVAKPDLKIYAILASRLEIDYANILFVDDFIENIHAAQSLGMQCIHYKAGINLINRIESTLDP